MLRSDATVTGSCDGIRRDKAFVFRTFRFLHLLRFLGKLRLLQMPTNLCPKVYDAETTQESVIEGVRLLM